MISKRHNGLHDKPRSYILVRINDTYVEYLIENYIDVYNGCIESSDSNGQHEIFFDNEQDAIKVVRYLNTTFSNCVIASFMYTLNPRVNISL